MAPKSVPVPMIRRVRLHNFRSIADCDVELGPLTLLVGPNGSGKSNFLHALDFLSDALNNGLESAVRRRGGMNSLLSRWALNDPEATLRIEVDLDLAEQRSGTFALALRRTTSGGFKVAEEAVSVTAPSLTNVERRFHVGASGSTTWVGPVFGPRLGIDPHVGRALTLPNAANDRVFGLVHEALAGMSCYSFNVDEMRRPQEVDGGERLKPDGSNVASVLERLSEKNDLGWVPSGRIEDWLPVVTPGLEAVRGVNVAGYQVLQFEQRPARNESPWSFTAGEMSYGTLRWLGVLVAIYQGLMSGGSPVTLVGIEEPESAVHPGAATAILEAMDEASLTTQVLATTHSATMLEHEDLDLDVLRVVVRVNGRTVIGPVDAASRKIVEEGIYSAGELLRMRHLMPAEPADGQQSERPIAAPA